MRAPQEFRRRRIAVWRFLVVVLAPALVALLFPVSGTASASSSSPSTLALTGQFPAVVTKASGLTVGVSVRSALPADQLGIAVTLFDKAQYVDTFEQTLQGSPAGLGVMSGTSQAIPLSTFERQADGGSFDISLPVSAPGVAGNPSSPRRGTLLQLSCSPGQCAGVYPLLVSLTNLNDGETLATFMTYLVLDPPAETAQASRILFAWVMTVGSHPAITATGAGRPAASDTRLVSQLAAASRSYPSVPLNLNVVPQFVEGLALDKRSPTSAAALSSLRAFARSPSRFEMIPAPFTNVNLSGLRESGLASDTVLQLTEGRATLRKYLGTAGQTNEFAALTPIAGRIAAGLASAGVNSLVVPSDSVVPAAPANVVYAALSPFVVRNVGVEAVASEYGLQMHLGGSGNAVLRANQLLANLAELFFQVPNSRKGVTLLCPAGWSPGSSFLDTVMAGLAGNPLVKAATVSELFGIAPGAAGGASLLRTRSLEGSSASPPLPEPSIGTGRAQLLAVSSIMPSATTTTSRLTEAYLLSETAGITEAQRAAYLSEISGALRRTAELLSPPFGHTVTLTSLNAKVPLTIVSRASVPIYVKIALSSPELGFTRVHSFTVRLLPHTNIVPVELTARTSGDFPLEIQVLAPAGSYLLLSGRVTIRSTAISGVAVAISVAALAFLVIWWSRSIMKRRRKLHRERGALLAAGGRGGNPEGV